MASCDVCPKCKSTATLRVGEQYLVSDLTLLYGGGSGNVLANSSILKGRATVARSSLEEAREMLVVVKSVPLSSEPVDAEMARREVQLFRDFQSEGLPRRHPHLLPLLFGAETETELVLLAPYAPAGDLYSLTCVAAGTWKCLEEADASALAQQVLSGLAALHDLRYLHGDMKPQNIFLTKVGERYVAQIGDFGLTRKIPEESDFITIEAGGSTGYIAPEIIRAIHKDIRPSVSVQIDLFAVGVMFYQLLSSMEPFYPQSNVLAELEFDEVCWEPLLPDAQHFVSMLLAKNPEDRGTATSCINHEWLTKADAAPRGSQRPSYAPRPDTKLRFHPVGVEPPSSPSTKDVSMMKQKSASEVSFTSEASTAVGDCSLSGYPCVS